MKFGLSFLPDTSPSEMSASDYYKNALELSVMADQGGMSKIKMTEHYLHPYGGYCPSPLMFLSAVAAVTEQIRLITGCILPAFDHPIKIAAWCAMIDGISNGRLDVGFARAYLPYEFETFGVPMDESRERYKQTIEAVVKLWTEKDVTIDSPFFNFEMANSLPQPVQKGHPPVWGAATRSRESFSWIASKGFGLLVTNTISSKEQLSELIEIYRDCYIPSIHHPNKKSEVALSLPMMVHANDANAIEIGSKYLNNYFEVWTDSLKSWNTKSSKDYPGYTGLHHYLTTLKPSDLMSNNAALFGSPSAVIDTIYELQEWFGLDELLLQVDFGSMPIELSRKSLDLFLDKVLPEFSGK
jgi:alkanesulfonate monooxygenase SsuD/methylene tetrahydromethanopterin reductase-like flavin-dependent oxidoreductase (luciferase family)